MLSGSIMPKLRYMPSLAYFFMFCYSFQRLIGLLSYLASIISVFCRLARKSYLKAIISTFPKLYFFKAVHLRPGIFTYVVWHIIIF